MRLSQNFLINTFFISKFSSYIEKNIKPIIEVGCGKGSISKFINPDLCVEIDENLIKYIKDYNLIISDARFLPIRRGQIVSSLPYSITEDFFLEVSKLDEIQYLALILQKDFIDKILNYATYISFILNYIFDIWAHETVPPSAFDPRPKVYSIIVTFKRKRKYNARIDEYLKCVSRFRNKRLKNVGEYCGFISRSEKRVREFKPCQVIELLNLMGLNYA
ncbi:16S ribosomal RNA methyltransferase A [Acidianus sp. HS-5]|uniref:16S ribosomal RNA methyltransferase A n=1 Tax=Acidianus sp. HS-5 TaxID=2886040 RepID=UPI001F44D1D1|nr:16S ribosomal RNA methyltransferase A [Acidianus sp. HS-5]BDC19302.1 16S rRNA (adenine(1518)-N(6)/adenine(1519)-N(6)) - dimethyltransferase [Acidianus sp. HS-5]